MKRLFKVSIIVMICFSLIVFPVDLGYAEDESTVCEHDYTSEIVLEADCLHKEVIKYTCSLCGDTYTEEVGDFGEHQWNNEYTQDTTATCSEEGSESIHCLVCDAINQETVRPISKTNHEYSEWTVKKEATCTETGSRERVCNVCGEIESEEMPLLDHNLTKVEAKDATETEDGNIEYWHCTECDKYFSDENGTQEINAESVIVPKTGAEIVDSGTCGKNVTWELYDDGSLHICGNGDMYDYEAQRSPFYGLRAKITSIEIEDSITSIGKFAFQGLYGITRIVIPENVNSVGFGSLKECRNLKSLSMPLVGEMEVQTLQGANTLKNDYLGFVFGIKAPFSLPDQGKYDIPSGLERVTITGNLTQIGDSAFAYCSNIKSVDLPDSINSLGNATFKGCSSLTGISIPPLVSEIGNSTFNGCNNLHEISIPSSIRSIGAYAFAYCSGLSYIVIPDGVHYINYQTFYNCSNLSKIIIPDSVISIGDEAFGECTNMINITIPDGVTKIGHGAFKNCSSLRNLEIPASVTHIDFYGLFLSGKLESCEGILTGCTNLESISFPFVGKHIFETSTTIGNNYKSLTVENTYIGYLFGASDYSKNSSCVPKSLNSVTIVGNITTIPDNAFSGCSEIKEITYSNNIVAIGSSAFSGCTGLTNLTIPESVSSIGDYAFSSCSGLLGITLPEGITRIEASTFSGCIGLTNMFIPEKVTSIGNSAFSGCNGLKSIVIPESVISIGSSAFSNCSALISVCVPAGLKSLEWHTFYNCTSLKAIIIPEGIENIKFEALEGCTSLESITMPFIGTTIYNADTVNEKKYSNNYIGYVFGAESAETNSGCPDSLKNVTITGNLKTLEKNAFANCSEIKSVILPNSVTKIGDYAFKWCSGINSIILPDCITVIGDNAFEGCSNLIIDLPGNLSSIGKEAFKNCSSIKTITIPGKLSTIKTNAFENCNALESVYISDLKSWCELYFYSEKSNPIYYATSLLLNGSEASNIVIPEGTTSVGSYAFYGYSKLKNIVLPDSITSIGAYAFYNCSGLETITIPDGIKSISSGTFYKCSSLKSITAFRNVKTIGNDSFSEINPTAVIYTDFGSYVGKYFKSMGLEVVYVDHDFDDPNAIEIRTADELNAIRNNLSGSYKLVADIDLTSLTEKGGKYYNTLSLGWEPIGGNNGFSGYFDGNGHSIIGLKSNGGLFSENRGTIKNLTLKDGKTTGSVLNLDATLGCVSNYNYGGLIQNCINYNSIIYNGTNECTIGGITGSNTGTINNCTNYGSVYAMVSPYNGVSIYDAHCGGITGSNSGSVLGDNHGSVEAYAAKRIFAGGILGENAKNGLVMNSKNTASVIGINPKSDSGNDGKIVYCGGVVGKSEASIIDCINRGSVHGSCYMDAYTAGICGYLTKAESTGCENYGNIKSFSTGPSDCYAAGIVGLLNEGDGIFVSESINSGNIDAIASTGSAYSGGVVGDVGEGGVTDSFNDGEIGSYTEGTSSVISSAGGITAISRGGLIVKNGNAGTIKGVCKYENSSVSVCGGGICGYNQNDSLVSNCFSNGGLISYGVVGGLVGFNKGVISNSYSLDHFNTTGDPIVFGGIAGMNTSEGVINNVYSAITLTGSGSNGALLIGSNEGSVLGSLITCNVCGIDKKVISGYNDGSLVDFSKMKEKSSYPEFDFDTVWEMGTGEYNLPVLKETYGGVEWQKINRIDISGVKASLNKTSYISNGLPVNPTVTVPGLTEGTDYIYESDGRIDPGTGVVTLTGKGPFGGVLKLNYTITPGYSGWKQIDGYWYYYENGVMATSTWKKDSYGWCYLAEDGRMVTNDWAPDKTGMCWIGSAGYMVEKTQWIKVDGNWYYINKGYMVTKKWMKDSKGWCYVGADGVMVANGWAKDSKGLCWMDSTGHMLEKTQWVKYNGEWYHITKGYMDKSKWMKDSKGWCYVGADGVMVANGWAKDSKGLCWMDSTGHMLEKTQWVKYEGGWYYIEKGYMAKNKWAKDSIGWCYLSDTGLMVTNDFVKDSKGYCWIGPDGYMEEVDKWIGEPGVAGSSYIIKGYRVDNQTILIDGKYYTFDKDGKLIP